MTDLSVDHQSLEVNVLELSLFSIVMLRVFLRFLNHTYHFIADCSEFLPVRWNVCAFCFFISSFTFSGVAFYIGIHPERFIWFYSC